MESKNRETERASERASKQASERQRASETREESANDSNLESSAFGRAWRCQVCPANLCNATPSLRASFEQNGEPTFLRRDLEIELRGAISAERGTRVDWVQGTTDLESSLQISSGSFEATYSKAANTARLKA